MSTINLNVPMSNLTEYQKEINPEVSSVCTDCQEELNNLHPQLAEDGIQESSELNNFDDYFLTNIEKIYEPLDETTRSLSTISLEHKDCSEDNNQKCPSNIDIKQIYVININNEVELNADTMKELFNSNREHDLQQSQVKSNKVFCDKEVQTDPDPNTDSDLWDPEFPSEIELQNIDVLLQNTTEADKHKSQSKLNLQHDIVIKKKSQEIDMPNYSTMSSILMNRRKRLVDLSNDIYQLSTYLDNIRKALNSKEPLAKITIPSPPPMTGYDSQFDFPNEKRFGKLPITIDSSKSLNKLSSQKDNSTNVKLSARAGFTSNLVKKRMKSNDRVSASKRFMGQVMSKEVLPVDKEDQSRSYRKNSTISDNTSMYAYNPLSNRSKKNSKHS